MTNFHNYPFFTHIYSEENARTLLQGAYEKQFDTNVEKMSYQNASSFMYAFSSGIDFFEQGKRAPILTQPLLYFYACSHLIKGLLISMNATYPNSTKDLAHGLSSRKKKKKDYAFLQDEVRVQRHGLLPVAASSLYQINVESNKTYSMQHLLALIPEMQPMFVYRGKNYLDQIGFIDDTSITFSENLLSNYHLPIQGMLQKVKPYIPEVTHIESSKNDHIIHLQTPITSQTHPFFIEHLTGKLFIPNRRAFFTVLDELLVNYMVLYNLSMITRYEMEWWGELIATKATIDFPIIQHFLHVTTEKLPSIIHTHIKNIFDTNIM